MIDRRTFLRNLAALTASLMLPIGEGCAASSTLQDRLGGLLPLRKLGSTGENVTMLGVGGAHVAKTDEKTAQAIIETAMEGGVRFFDNAETYRRGKGETHYGKFLCPKYRDIIYLMTKTTARDAATARKHLEDSLRRMNTDYVDLWQIHAIASPEDVDNRIAEGILKVVLEAKESGKVRHVGFTGHTDYKAHLRMLEVAPELQVCQMPMNLYDPNYKSFILNVLPKLIEQNVGVLAMKTLANGGFFGGTWHYQKNQAARIIPDYASIRQALHFVWSLPVSVIITGAENADMLQEKIDLARAFSGMEEEERQALIDRVVDFDGSKVEYYKA